jgi:hypothetical protein
MALRWGCALAALLAIGETADAAWNNVFQVCCHNCGTPAPAPVVAHAAPSDCCPQPSCCPQQQCTTRYVQRCYYQAVTTYKQVSFYEPVTTYRTSFYYEPVCTYKFACVWDPCTCSYKQVAQPVTSYRLRSQCCPVTSYLQRCALQPCTSYRQVSYYEPVTTCCQTSCSTTVGAPVTTPPPGATINQQPGATITQPPPSSTEGQGNGGPPTNSESQLPNTGRLRPMPPAEGNSYRQPQLKSPVASPAPSQPGPNVRLERIVSLPSPNLSGQVVGNGKPQAGAKVLLVSADKSRTQQTVTADRKGNFEVTLASGSWLVYVHGADGKPVFQDRVDVRDDSPRQVVLTSR